MWIQYSPKPSGGWYHSLTVRNPSSVPKLSCFISGLYFGDIHIYIYVYIYTYIHTYIYIYTQWIIISKVYLFDDLTYSCYTMDNHCHQSIHHPSTVTVNVQFSIAKPLKYWKVGDYKPTNIIKRGSLGQHSDSPGKCCEAVQRFWDFSGIKLNAPVGRPWKLYLRIWLSASGTLLCCAGRCSPRI